MARPGSTFYCDTPLQSLFLDLLPDSILSVVSRCSSLDCNFLDVILFVALSSNILIVALHGSTFILVRPSSCFDCD